MTGQFPVECVVEVPSGTMSAAVTEGPTIEMTVINLHGAPLVVVVDVVWLV